MPLQIYCGGRFDRALWGGHVSFFPSWVSATLVAEAFFYEKIIWKLPVNFFNTIYLSLYPDLNCEHLKQKPNNLKITKYR